MSQTDDPSRAGDTPRAPEPGSEPPEPPVPEPLPPPVPPVPRGAPGPTEPLGLGPPHLPLAPEGETEPLGLGPPHLPLPPLGQQRKAPGADEPASPLGLGPPHLAREQQRSDAPPPDAEPGPGGEGATAPASDDPPAPPTTDLATSLPDAPPPAPPWAVPPPPPATPTPPWAAPGTIRQAPPGVPSSRIFGDHMATGVLLTMAGGSAAAGSILALQQTDSLSFTSKALVCGGTAALLLAVAVVLRLVRGSEELRGALAIVGLAFATACLAFAYDPAGAGDHDNLVKFALGSGIVAVLGWFACIVVPSAVAGLLAAIALPAAVGAGVWLGFSSPTHVQVYVAALCVGLLLALLLPRVRAVRPHPIGLGWALGGAVVAVTLPAVELTTRGDAVAMASGATAAAGLLLLAQRHRHLPAAAGAVAGLAVLEGELVSRYLATNNGAAQSSQFFAVAAAGAALILLIAAGILLTARGRVALRWPVPVLRPGELMLLASLALALVALATGPGDVPFNPPQLSSGSTATHAVVTPTRA